ncbi:hypothetical protein, partial [Variovorax beijingensis]|uniref:hypothetical protein n=1 Tax=Variovorax beijingensis TaxID=2496117 RepID=UPI003F69EE1F
AGGLHELEAAHVRRAPFEDQKIEGLPAQRLEQRAPFGVRVTFVAEPRHRLGDQLKLIGLVIKYCNTHCIPFFLPNLPLRAFE